MNKLNVIQHRQIDQLRIFFVTNDYRTPHFHKDFEILWILDGSLTVQSGDFYHVAREGEMILINSNCPHELRKNDKSCTMMVIQFLPSIVSREVPLIDSIYFDEFCLTNFIPRDLYRQVQRSWLEMAYQYFKRTSYYELFCTNQIQSFIYILLMNVPHQVLTTEKIFEQERQNARLQRLIQFVNENYMNKIRLTDFAESEGRSMSCISHFMKKTTHQSFQEYVNTVRFNAACEMMAKGKMKMLDICIASGFSDYRYFSNTFVKRTGLTPEAYSLQVKNTAMDETKSHHSSASLQRYYSPESSLKLVEKFKLKYK